MRHLTLEDGWSIMDPARIRRPILFKKYLVNCLEIACLVGWVFIMLWWRKASCPFPFTLLWTPCLALRGSPHADTQRWLNHATVPRGCCALQSMCLEIKLLQPHGCMTTEQCGHGKSKLLCCALGLGFTSLCSLSSSSRLKFSFTETYSQPQSRRAKSVLPHPQSCSKFFWLVKITEMLL